MKARELRKETSRYIFPKDMMNKTFLFDDNLEFKKIRVNNNREDKERYVIKVIVEGNGKLLCLTKRARDDLLEATSKYEGIVIKVRFEGKTGECKGTHWLFSVVDDAQQSKPELKISSFM